MPSLPEFLWRSHCATVDTGVNLSSWLFPWVSPVDAKPEGKDCMPPFTSCSAPGEVLDVDREVRWNAELSAAALFLCIGNSLCF
jgi:hypothetical protein